MPMSEDWTHWYAPSNDGMSIVIPHFLTKENVFKLTDVAPVEIKHIGDVFCIGNQVVYDKTSHELDRYGRNLIDKQFCHLCILIHVYASLHEDSTVFTSLSCKKESDRYIVSVKFDNEAIEMELPELLDYFLQRQNEAVA